MNVQELFKHVGFEAIMEYLISAEGASEDMRPAYKMAYDQMCRMKIEEESLMVVRIEEKYCEELKKLWYDVYGMYRKGDVAKYAIEHIPWRESLAYVVDPELLEKWEPAKVAGWIIWEYTFLGYYEEEESV